MEDTALEIDAMYEIKSGPYKGAGILRAIVNEDVVLMTVQASRKAGLTFIERYVARHHVGQKLQWNQTT